MMKSLKLITLARCVALLVLSLSGMAHAATYIVTNTNDSGVGSLRQAMLSALATPANDDIVFAAGANGVITLASPLPDLLASGGRLRIIGNGPADTIIDGNNQHRPFHAVYQNGLQFSLSHLSVRNGLADQLQGGAIYANGSGNLSITDVEFDSNRATYGGGAIYTTIATVIHNSTFVDNHGGNSVGGAIDSDAANLIVSNSTFTDNFASSSVIRATPPINRVARLINLTITGNRSQHAVELGGDGRSTLINSIVLDNGYRDIVSNNNPTFDLDFSTNNIIGISAIPGIIDGVSGNQVGVTSAQARLSPLGWHGGTTRTMALLPASPALDGGVMLGVVPGDPNPILIPDADQRGIARVGAVDIGAFESSGFAMAAVSGSGQSAATGTAFADPLIVEVTPANTDEPVEGGAVTFTAPTSGASAGFSANPALIDNDGRAQVVATANASIGGPYTVTASVPSGTATPSIIDFSLTNTPAGNPACVSFTFPYTLSGADNTARVVELRQAIDCANGNASDDAINLGGHVLTFSDAPYDAASGANVLPPISSVIELRGGSLEMHPSIGASRFLRVLAGAHLVMHSLQLRGATISTEGGAVLAEGDLEVRNSRFEDNQASNYGGAIVAYQTLRILNSHFIGNAAHRGAAVAHRGTTGMLMVFNSQFLRAGMLTNPESVVWSSAYSAFVNSLFANNQLTRPDSRLLYFTSDAPVVEMRNVTVADNQVQGVLLQRDDSPVQIRNSIVWGNQFGSLGALTPMTSILQGVAGMSSDPLFLDAAQGNYRLAATSPAIDAGDNANGYPDIFDIDDNGITAENMPDLDLNPRPVDIPTVPDTGIGTAPLLDLGAYERQTSACYDVTFPYTVSGSDNTARVAELRQAIECANANATTDVIDLAGFTLLLDTLDANTADTALPAITSAITLRNGTLQRDVTAADFRLLVVDSSGHLIGEHVDFRNGQAFDGAAIYNRGTLELNDAGFFDNGHLVLTYLGGAIYSRDTLRIVDSRFEGNAAYFGGAIFHDYGDLWLRGSHLENNQANEGGALYSLDNMNRLYDNTFIANRAQRGGAIRSQGAQISRSHFERNTAVTLGGAIFTEHADTGLHVSNSLFIDNQAPDDAALIYADGWVALRNVTISGHVSGAASSLFAATAGTTFTMDNSIVWGNAGTSIGSLDIRHSVVEGGYPGGTAILDVDPRFVDAANGDFRLASGSPAIDAGNNASVAEDFWVDINDDGVMEGELDDLDGAPRRYDDTGVIDTGVGTAPIVDMGAYEKQTNSTLEANLSITNTDGATEAVPGGSVTYTITAANLGPAAVTGATVTDTFPPSLTCTWTCVGAGSGTCPASGSGNINHATVNLPVNASVTYTAACAISASASGILSNTATIAAPNGITDPVPGNNSATDTTMLLSLPTLNIDDVSRNEGDSSITAFNFTVSLSSAALAGGVSFDIATANGTAVAPGDYTARSLTGRTIPAGSSSYTFTVQVNGDTDVEDDETFFVKVSNVTGATVLDAQGTGTILNDDVAADFDITTTPTSITVTDSSANGSVLQASEPSAGFLRFSAPGRTFSVNGGAPAAHSGDLDLTGVTLIILNAPGGSSVASGEVFNIGEAALSSASAITLAGGTLSTSGSAAVVNAPVVLAADSDLVGNMTLAAPISGDFTLRTVGAGTYRFSATGSTFARLNIASGSVVLDGDDTLPPQVDLSNSSTLDLNGASQSIDFYAGNGGTVNTAAVAANLTLGVAGSSSSSGEALYYGPISGAINLTCAVDCQQTLGSNSSSYTGITTVLGTLTVRGDGALGADGAGNGTLVAATGVLELRDVNYLLAEPLTIDGGTLRVANGNSRFNGPITLTTSAATIHAGSALELELAGVISGNEGIEKTGVGTLRLSAANTYTGATVIDDGSVWVTGTLAATSAVSVNTGGTLGGTGTVNGPINIASGGTLSPGLSPGTLHTGNLVFASGATFAAEIDGATVDTGYDQLDVNGTLTLNGATLALSGSHVPAIGQSFVLIDNDGSDAVSGTFDGLPNDATRLFNGVNVRIRYDGGDGNDVVLTGVPPSANVLSLERATANPTNAANSSWVLRFDTPISGLNASHFTLVPNGLGGTPSLNGISASGGTLPNDRWVITVATGSGSGTIGLDMVNATGLSHALGNLPYSGQVFTIDRTPPTVTITVVDDELSNGETSPVSFVFSERVQQLPPAQITIENGTLSTPTSSDNITWTALLTPTPDIVEPINVITLDMAGIRDTVGNFGAGNTTSNNYAIDTRANSLSIDDVARTEGSSGSTTAFTFTVSLSTAATAPVTFDIATADDSATVGDGDYVARALTAQTIPVGSSTYTFDVIVNGDDVVEGNETFFVNVTNVTGATAANAQGTGTGTILNDDVAGLSVSPTSGLITTEAGGTATFTVVLDTQPTADVTIPLVSSDTSEGTVSPASLTFTPANWNLAQTVTLTGVDDDEVDGDMTYWINLGPSTSADTHYDGVVAPRIAALNQDDDQAAAPVPTMIPAASLPVLWVMALLMLGAGALTSRRLR